MSNCEEIEEVDSDPRSLSLPENIIPSESPRFIERNVSTSKKSPRNSSNLSDIFSMDFHPFEKDESKKYVLSLDGGGMRVQGIITILKEIEKQTHRRIHNIFDLIVGTGNSGILAFMLTSGITLDKAHDIFIEIGEDVFDSTSFASKITHISNLKNAGWYSVNVLEKCLKDYFCGERTLGDFFQYETKCIAVASRTSSIGSYYSYAFRNYESPFEIPPQSYKGTFKKEHKNISMIPILRATTATPFFFEPVEINDKTYYAGSLSSYNPSKLAKREADELWPNDDIVLVSVGSGKHKENEGYNEKSRKNFTETAKKFFQDMLATLTNASDVHKYMMDQVGYSKGTFIYFRLDPPNVGSILPYKSNENDIDEMRILVMKYISDIQLEIIDICKILGIDKNAEPPCEDNTLMPQEKPHVIVHIHEAKNLTPQNINGFADPFVLVHILPGNTGNHTTVAHKSLNPKFNQKFTFDCTKQIKRANLSGAKVQLFFQVLNKNVVAKDTSMGTAIVNIHDLNVGEPKLYSLKLENIEQGELHVKIESQLWEINVKSLQSKIIKQSSLIDQLIDETENQRIEIVELQSQVANLTKLVYSIIPPEKMNLSTKELNNLPTSPK
eukprot:gene7091-11254_t